MKQETGERKGMKGTEGTGEPPPWGEFLVTALTGQTGEGIKSGQPQVPQDNHVTVSSLAAPTASYHAPGRRNASGGLSILKCRASNAFCQRLYRPL